MTPEERRDYNRKYYAENRERVLENQKKFHQENKEKKADYARKYRSENKSKIAAKAKEYNKKYRLENRDYFSLVDIRTRAKRRGLPFNLEIDDLVYPEICPVLGLKLSRNTKAAGPTSPSVDRIIPELGYVKGNIQIISNKANTMKSDATPEELRMFARWVLKTFPEESDGKT